MITTRINQEDDTIIVIPANTVGTDYLKLFYASTLLGLLFSDNQREGCC